jgi:hypothetical protein
MGDDLPTWISAIASLLTVAVAGLAVVTAGRALRANSRRTELMEELVRRREAEQDRHQADLVAAWPVSEHDTFQKVITRGIVGAAIRNASSMPIYYAEITYRDDEAAWSAVRQIQTVAPGDEPQVFAGFDRETSTGTPKPERINQDGSVRLSSSAHMKVELRFTDAQGRGWCRDDLGILTPLGDRARSVPEPVEDSADSVHG